MAFATPWYLLGLLGIGIPVAIHLIRRQRAERIVLPTVRFLKAAPKKLIFSQRIQQWLLLALRVAIVGLLAVAFARPIVTGAYSDVVGAKPKSLIILLDTSMSMRYADRFDRGKAAVIDIIRSLKTGDEAGVVTFAESPGRMQALTTDLSALEAFVRSIPAPGYRSTDFLTALRLADQLLQTARYPDKTVVLVSDFQKSAAPAADHAWKLSPGIGLNVVSVGNTETFNLAVAEGHLVGQQDTYTLVARIQNTGTAHVDTAKVSLAIDGTALSSRTLDLQGQTETRAEFPFTLKQTGMHRGTLTLAGDRFAPDNMYHFAVAVEPVIRVLCVSGEAAGSGSGDQAYWFRAALGQKAGASFQVDVIDPGRLALETLASYAVVALLNVGSLAQEQVDALRAYVKGGGGLLLAPADRVDADRYNRQYGDLTPALLGRKINHADGAVLTIPRGLATHPLIRALQVDEKMEFGTARFYTYWAADPAADSRVMMRFEDDDPALVARRVGNGRVLLFASSLDPAWNNFPVQVTYLPLLHEAVRHLAGRRDAQMSYRVGDLVPIPVPPGGAARVTSPGGEATLLRAGPAGVAFYPATAEPGIYQTRSGNLPGNFAVNAAIGESELASANPDDIRDRLVASETPGAPARSERGTPFRAEREQSQRAWWWVLLLVAAMSLVETLLANRTYR